MGHHGPVCDQNFREHGQRRLIQINRGYAQVRGLRPLRRFRPGFDLDQCPVPRQGSTIYKVQHGAGELVASRERMRFAQVGLSVEGPPMIKSILVPATGNDSDAEVFSSALAVARPLGAHLDFLHRLDAESFAAMMSPEVGGAHIVTDLIGKLEEQTEQRQQRAKESFESFCRCEGLAVAESPPAVSMLSATWLEESGSEALSALCRSKQT